MQRVRQDTESVEIAWRVTWPERCLGLALAAVFVFGGVVVVGVAAMLIPARIKVLDAVFALPVGLCVLLVGLYIAKLTLSGDRTIRFDWSRRMLSETTWRPRAGYRSRVWPMDEIEEISVRQSIVDGVTTFYLWLDLRGGETLGAIASYSGKDEAGHLAHHLRRAAGIVAADLPASQTG